MNVKGFERDGLQFAVAIPPLPQGVSLAGATASATARLMSGGAEISAASATITGSQIAVDFGAGVLAKGLYSVQVGVSIAGRFSTLWAGTAIVHESLGD